MPDKLSTNELSPDELIKLIKYLSQFTTENRIDRIRNVLNLRTRHISLLLEDLYQPHNASAVIRSCDAFGIQDIHVVEDINRFRPSSGVAMGSEQWMTIRKYRGETGLADCIGMLKSRGYTIAATTPHGDTIDINQLPVDEKLCLMFGSELTGLSDKALELADVRCRIPMAGFAESFNISVSAAICLYDLTTRLRSSDIAWQLQNEEKRKLEYEWLLNSVRAGEKLARKYLKEDM